MPARKKKLEQCDTCGITIARFRTPRDKPESINQHQKQFYGHISKVKSINITEEIPPWPSPKASIRVEIKAYGTL